MRTRRVRPRRRWIDSIDYEIWIAVDHEVGPVWQNIGFDREKWD